MIIISIKEKERGTQKSFCAYPKDNGWRLSTPSSNFLGANINNLIEYLKNILENNVIIFNDEEFFKVFKDYYTIYSSRDIEKFTAYIIDVNDSTIRISLTHSPKSKNYHLHNNNSYYLSITLIPRDKENTFRPYPSINAEDYIYYTENNNIDRYDNIIKGIIDFIETGKYVDYANCDEKHTSPSDSNFGNITMNLIKKIEASAQKILQKYFGVKNLVNTKITVVDLPINSIYTDVKRFQNRQNAYSEKSVEKIINAVLNNTFDIDRFDPILVWKDPKNKKTYVLSGHSRLEAFKRLYKEMGYITFATIPSKYFKGNESQAIETALNSNTQATKETAVERAFYYQRLRKNGMSEKEIENKCKEIEDKNGTYIYHLSFLNPDGYLMDALRNLDIEKEGQKDTENLKSISNWVGEARKKYKELSNLQESELAKYLINGGYLRLKSKVAFILRLENAYNKWKSKGADPNESLNLDMVVGKSAFENEFDLKLEEAKKEYDFAEKELNRIQAELNSLFKEDSDLFHERIKPYLAAKQRAYDKYVKLSNRRNEVKQAEKAQQSLWGITKEEKDFIEKYRFSIDTENYDSKHINNVSTKVIPIEKIKEIYDNGITTEILNKLNVPVYFYRTQITIHGLFNEIEVDKAKKSGYSSIILNKNKSLGVRYVDVDYKKKLKLYDAIKKAILVGKVKNFEKFNYASARSNSQSFYLSASMSFEYEEFENNKKYFQTILVSFIKELKEKLNKLCQAKISLYYEKGWSSVSLIFDLEILAIQEKNIPKVLATFTDCSFEELNSLYAKYLKDKELKEEEERKKSKEEWRKRCEEADRLRNIRRDKYRDFVNKNFKQLQTLVYNTLKERDFDYSLIEDIKDNTNKKFVLIEKLVNNYKNPSFKEPSFKLYNGEYFPIRLAISDYIEENFPDDEIEEFNDITREYFPCLTFDLTAIFDRKRNPQTETFHLITLLKGKKKHINYKDVDLSDLADDVLYILKTGEYPTKNLQPIENKKEMAKEVQELKKYSHLTPITSEEVKKYKQHLACGRNIRAELKKNYPNTKFSVRYSSFSGGNEYFVEWELGPVASDVDSLLHKFQEYGGMEIDDSTYDNRDGLDSFRAKYGSVKFIICQRKEDKDTQKEAERISREKFGISFKDADFNQQNEIWEIISKTDYSKQTKQKAKQEAKEPSKANNIVGDGIKIDSYSEKSWVVTGQKTKEIKDTLNEMGGRFNFRLTCGPGWIFKKSNTDLEELKKVCGITDGNLEEIEQKAKKLIEKYF